MEILVLKNARLQIKLLYLIRFSVLSIRVNSISQKDSEISKILENLEVKSESHQFEFRIEPLKGIHYSNEYDSG